MTNFKIFKYANPAKFLYLCEKTFIYLVLLTIIFLSFGLYQGFFNSPEDYQQGNLVRIMYVHVPSAWMALMIYSSIAIASCIYLINKHLLANIFCKSASLIGASFTLIAIVTGSIWGKPTWGTWWVWDARLTSTLILFFLYAGIIGLYSSIDNKQKGDRAASLISVVGVIIIPVIKKSVDWWQTLHQSSTFTITSAPSMTPDMYLPLLICVIGFYSILLSMLLNRLRAEILIRERNTSWVQQYLNNQVRE